MKMLGFEKLLVNSPWSKKRGLTLAKKLLEFVQFDDGQISLKSAAGTE